MSITLPGTRYHCFLQLQSKLEVTFVAISSALSVLNVPFVKCHPGGSICLTSSSGKYKPNIRRSALVRGAAATNSVSSRMTMYMAVICYAPEKRQDVLEPITRPHRSCCQISKMSSVYASEPASSGRVLFQTTHGPLEIQLWCRECPTTTKLFLQLCLDGFYDNMIFHRIVPDFLIQTGALRPNKRPAKFETKYQNDVQAPEALERRKYETHSRLRFNHRGQLAMALAVEDDIDQELQPQFFITLEEAPYLDSKHVLFGTISGPTIFNAVRIGKLGNDDNEPADAEHAPRITSVKIVDNPIHTSLVPHPSPPWREEKTTQAATKKKKKKRKGKKDVNVLSFGNELEEDLEDATPGMQSSHDIVSSSALGKEVDEQVKVAAKDTTGSMGSSRSETAQSMVESNDDDAGQDLPPKASSIVPKFRTSAVAPQAEPVPLSRPQKHEEPDSKDSSASSQPGVSSVEARRAKYMKRSKTSKSKREEETLARLMSFQSKVQQKVSGSKSSGTQSHQDNSLAARMARKAAARDQPNEPIQAGPAYGGQVLDDSDEDETKGDWLATRFKCKRHIDHSSRMDKSGGDGRDMNDYLVVDDREKDTRRPKHDRGGSSNGHHKRFKSHKAGGGRR